jgi:hypothetical protein
MFSEHQILALVPSLNLRPNLRGGTAKKATRSPYEKNCCSNSKRENKKGHYIQNITNASNVLLGSSKRWNRRVCWDSNPSNSPSDSETKLAIPLADDATEEDEEQDADCLYCTGRFSEDRAEGNWIRCANCFRWEHTLCAGMEEDFVCEPCQG